MLKQKLSLSLVQDQITGFSYSFVKTLTEFLQRRLETDTIFVEDHKRWAKDHPDQSCRSSTVEPEVLTAMRYLHDQIRGNGYDESLNGVCDLVDHAEKFLAIFEKNK
jgi:hypothetical protein